VPVLLIDTFAGTLDTVRAYGLAVLEAEMLSVHGEKALSGSHLDYLIAATDDAISNGFVCARFVPELGWERVLQLATGDDALHHRRGLARAPYGESCSALRSSTTRASRIVSPGAGSSRPATPPVPRR
jgi:hypothetical protein